MIVAIDTNCLVRWSSPKKFPDDVARLDLLLDQIGRAKGKLLLPTPVLAEYLVMTAEATAGWMAGFERKKSIVLGSLDRRAAYECASMDRSALGSGDKKSGRKDSWQRIKIDRQIIAIARVAQADMIVSDDVGLISTAAMVGIPATKIGDLPLPDSAKQQRLDLPEEPG